jgi:phosphatidylglycerophosphate synthase
VAGRFTIEEIRSRSYKSRDSWWTVLLVDPLASRLVQVAVRFRWITPNRLTVASFLVGVAAALCFAQADYRWLVAGAMLFHLSFVFDCMDGKIARLTGTGSVFGAWLDYVLDRLRVLVCAVALMGGQYERTGEFTYVLICGLVIFLDMFRYLDALKIGQVKNMMRARLAEAEGVGASPLVFFEDTVQEHPIGAAALDNPADGRRVVDVNVGFRSRFGSFVRLRNSLVRRRIRAHLFSGIEFQMAVFIVAPLTNLVISMTLAASALLLVFELLLIYKLWLATKDFARQLEQFDSESSSPAPGAVEVLDPTMG